MTGITAPGRQAFGESLRSLEAQVGDLSRQLQRLWADLTSPWEPLLLAPTVEYNTGAFVPAARLDQVAQTVRLRGLLKVKTGSEVMLGGVLFTLPASTMHPALAIGMASVAVSGSVRYVQVEPAGEAKLGVGALTAGDQLWLDGLTFSIRT